MSFVSVLLDKYKLGNRLRNDAEIADSLGVTRASVSRWRCGAGQPEPAYALLLVKNTGVDASYVLMRLEMDRARNKDNKHAWAEVLKHAKFSPAEELPIPFRKRA